MGFMDELKKLTHPYSETDEDEFDEYDEEESIDNEPPAAPTSRSSFSRSPSIRRETGIPVQRATIRAISSSVT